ncbi:MAG: FHA domain-containing protein [Microscillaceae bacterium]|nr:FHA domain-containing protein [Microscillaceae bacterium]MDW8461759.1 FHA domain-containing protein [Cytophagales bacterium]
MSDFKLCENGHYYPKSQAFCPYCPKIGGSEDNLRATMQGKEDNFEGQPDIFGGSIGSIGRGNLSRTQIFTDEGGGVSFGSGDFGSQPKQVRKERKLVGWLVSFTLDEYGKDFRLYEGRNTIGSSYECDIQIDDPAVSAKHLTILYRMGHFKFKDELSTNGTFINDIFEEEGTLKDGDMIRIGDTVFKFRSIA